MRIILLAVAFWQDFVTGLQFLTRINLMKEHEWTALSFGRSVKCFPLVGAVIGLFLVLINLIGEYYLPLHLQAVLILLTEFLITGGLHFDGFMDTMDGLLSGREREKILQIMKDSRVGANAVMSFGMLILLKWSILLDASPAILPHALWTMPIVSRFAMVLGIVAFPYARREGIGKLFTQYAGKKSLVMAAIFTVMLLIPSGKPAYICAVTGLFFAMLFARFAVNKLGGLTGDVYGAINEITEIVVLLIFVFIS